MWTPGFSDLGRVENPVAPVRLNDCVAAGPCLEVFGAELTCGRLENAHLRDIYHLLNLDSSARPVRQTANCTTRNNLCFMSIVKNSKKQLNNAYRRPNSSRDVENHAHDRVQVKAHENRGNEVREETALVMNKPRQDMKKEVTYAMIKYTKPSLNSKVISWDLPRRPRILMADRIRTVRSKHME